MCRSFATKVFYVVSVGDVDVVGQTNLVEPRSADVSRRLDERQLVTCNCRAKRSWRIMVRGSVANVSAQVSSIRDAVLEAWASSLQSVRKW